MSAEKASTEFISYITLLIAIHKKGGCIQFARQNKGGGANEYGSNYLLSYKVYGSLFTKPTQ